MSNLSQWKWKVGDVLVYKNSLRFIMRITGVGRGGYDYIVLRHEGSPKREGTSGHSEAKRHFEENFRLLTPVEEAML